MQCVNYTSVMGIGILDNSWEHKNKSKGTPALPIHLSIEKTLFVFQMEFILLGYILKLFGKVMIKESDNYHFLATTFCFC